MLSQCTDEITEEDVKWAIQAAMSELMEHFSNPMPR